MDAQNVYDYLVKHDPSHSGYQAKLAYCKLNLKSYEDAVAWYEKSLALDPGHPNRYYNLALAYRIMGKRQAAARAIRRALELEPQNQKYREMLKSV
jgi:tetratricopeptide (TPR) repeat protein